MEYENHEYVVIACDRCHSHLSARNCGGRYCVKNIHQENTCPRKAYGWVISEKEALCPDCRNIYDRSSLRFVHIKCSICGKFEKDSFIAAFEATGWRFTVSTEHGEQIIVETYCPECAKIHTIVQARRYADNEYIKNDFAIQKFKKENPEIKTSNSKDFEYGFLMGRARASAEVRQYFKALWEL